MGYLSIKPNYPSRYTGKKSLCPGKFTRAIIKQCLPLRHQRLEEEATFTWPSQSGLQEQLHSGPLATGADVPAFAPYGDGGSREPQQDKPKHPKPSYLCAVSGLWDSEMQRQTPRLLGLPSQGQAPPLPKLFLPSMLS